MPAPCKTFHCLTVSEVGSSWYKKHPGRTSRSLGALPPPPPPSPWAVELLAPAAGYLIAGSGEKQRSASRLEALTPSPSRCRRSHLRNKLHSHLPLHYPPHQTCTTPLGSTSASGLFLTYAYAFHDCGSSRSAPAFIGSGLVNRPKADP